MSPFFAVFDSLVANTARKSAWKSRSGRFCADNDDNNNNDDRQTNRLLYPLRMCAARVIKGYSCDAGMYLFRYILHGTDIDGIGITITSIIATKPTYHYCNIVSDTYNCIHHPCLRFDPKTSCNKDLYTYYSDLTSIVYSVPYNKTKME